MTRIAIGHTEIGRVMAGEQTLFIRPAAGAFRKIAVGARLWLAEPFFLPHAFVHLAPTAARDRGAKPAFVADYLHAPAQIARTHGPRQPARSLCKEWHRAHLIVRERTELRLHDLGPEHFACLGFRSPAAFADHWNREMGLFSSRGHKWHNNPRALLFRFELVLRPLSATTPPTRRPAEVAPAQPTLPTPPPVQRRGPPGTRRSPSIPVHEQPAVSGTSFSTAKGDEGFLAALSQERPACHSSAAPIRSAPARCPTIIAPLPANGTCPRCGTRLAFGCKHYPAHDQDASRSTAVGLTKDAAA